MWRSAELENRERQEGLIPLPPEVKGARLRCTATTVRVRLELGVGEMGVGSLGTQLGLLGMQRWEPEEVACC